MRFTDGMWQTLAGVRLHRVESQWRYEIVGSEVRFLVPCHEIRDLGDTTSGVNLHYTFSSPREDMISVKIEHFTGGVKRGPDFALAKTNPDVAITEDADTLTYRSGKLTAVIRKTGLFAYSFYYDGELLTGGGNRGACYATDVDYEAHRTCDYNGHRIPAHYNRETYIREVLSLDVGEYIYGLGERFGPYVKNGQSVDIWNRDGGSGCDQSYKNIPFYLSSKKYGVLVNTPGRVEFEVGSVNVRNVEFSVEGEGMEYIVIGGASPKEVLAKYTAMTGRADVPPAWTFGLWLSTSWVPDSDAKITMEFIDGMEKHGIPLSVFHFDARWMDDYNCCDFVWSERYGDAGEMLRKIHEKGVRVCVWINPYVSQESRLFREGVEGGYFLKLQNGDVYQTDNWMSGMAIVDVTNPAAREWYAGRLGEIVDMGVDAVKTDFGERIPVEEIVYHDGSDPRRMHNFYPYLYNEMIYGMLEKRKGEACVFSRSSTVGTQKFPVNWGGDNDASYISMAETLRGGLSFCQSGFGFWAHDISGFDGTATPDLYKRWAAFGLLSSHSRLHGRDSYRVPWCFDEECCEVLGFFTRLKCSLMPYLYAQAVRVRETGEPMMRAMMLEFPNDIACLGLDRQYMLGDSLLIAPIFREDGQVEFYVPEGGVWTNYLDGERFEGGRWYKRTYGYFGLPLLVKPGSVIAKGAVDSGPVYDYADGITWQLFDLVSGETACTVYDKDTKEAATLTVNRNGGKLTLSVSGSAGDWSVELMGVSAVQDAGGAQSIPGDRSLTLRPGLGANALTVLL